MAGRGRRTAPPRPPAGPPATADEGAARVRALLVQAFDRKDGTGADWLLMLESLYRAGFKIADERPDNAAMRFCPGEHRTLSLCPARNQVAARRSARTRLRVQNSEGPQDRFHSTGPAVMA
jgi:hypothetical protein